MSLGDCPWEMAALAEIAQGPLKLSDGKESGGGSIGLGHLIHRAIYQDPNLLTHVFM